jgi:hypothetical protein
MTTKVVAPNPVPPPHVIVAPMGAQQYWAVVSGNTGHEAVRCADQATAVKEKARLDKLLAFEG